MQTLTYLTADLPGVGGQIKQRPEDFLVEEQPLYPPTGAGEHLYVFIEKTLRSTSEVIRHLSKTFRVKKSEIGYAGLKDKQAVTRQMFSIRLPDRTGEQECLDRVGTDQIKLLWADRHENTLRRGHLAGNQFVIHIRGVEPAQVVRAKAVLDRLAQTGVANFIGQQRFGYRWVNHKLGRLLLLKQWGAMLDLMLGHPLEADHAETRLAREAYERGDYAGALDLLPRNLRQDRQALDALRQGKSAQEAVRTIDRQHRVFLISAMQSAIFNRVLKQRMAGEAGSPGIGRLMVGDLAWKHDNRSVFSVDQATADHENGPEGRVGRLEVSPSGPMWGVGMTQAGGLPEQWERQALADEGLTESDLHGGAHGKAAGSRRPMRVVLRDPEVSSGVDEHGAYIRLSFGLPRGSFATVVLSEVMKPEMLVPKITAKLSHGNPSAKTVD